MQCPECGADKMLSEKRDVAIDYKGVKDVVSGVEGRWCLSCGEGVLDGLNGDRIGQALLMIKNRACSSLGSEKDK